MEKRIPLYRVSFLTKGRESAYYILQAPTETVALSMALDEIYEQTGMRSWVLEENFEIRINYEEDEQ